MTGEQMCAPILFLLKANPEKTDGANRAKTESEKEPEAGRRTLRCKACQSELADEQDVFSATKEGPVGAYINPAGFLHEIVTLRAVRGISLTGPAVAQASWCIGYTWTIAICMTCQAHLGWQFDATTDQMPPTFWGLRRAAITEQ